MSGSGGPGGRWKMAAARSGAEGEEAAAAAAAGNGDGDPSVPATPGRAQVFAAVVDTFLEKLVTAGR